jgi:hypothetical protein
MHYALLKTRYIVPLNCMKYKPSKVVVSSPKLKRSGAGIYSPNKLNPADFLPKLKENNEQLRYKRMLKKQHELLFPDFEWRLKY